MNLAPLPLFPKQNESVQITGTVARDSDELRVNSFTRSEVFINRRAFVYINLTPILVLPVVISTIWLGRKYVHCTVHAVAVVPCFSAFWFCRFRILSRRNVKRDFVRRVTVVRGIVVWQHKWWNTNKNKNPPNKIFTNQFDTEVGRQRW